MEACREIPIAPTEQKLARALTKLVTDRCTFDGGATGDAPGLRRALFTRASAARRESGFDRTAIMEEIAGTRAIADIERALYADLPDAHRLVGFDAISPDGLLAVYDRAQVQAVLLTAVKVTAVVRAAAPGAYRDLFRRLKFLRLLFRIEPVPGGGYRLEIDGPYSLFESVTKYGLQLALAFPILCTCHEWELEADLRWGRDRRPLRFTLSGQGQASPSGPAVADDVAALLRQVGQLDTPWRAAVSGAVLDLPGVGVCVPDLEFRHADSGAVVYLEALGFWSRDAVWKRVELVERGLAHPIVFAVGKHLRVSEAALPDELPGRLYVYNRTMNARALLDRIEKAAGA